MAASASTLPAGLRPLARRRRCPARRPPSARPARCRRSGWPTGAPSSAGGPPPVPPRAAAAWPRRWPRPPPRPRSTITTVSPRSYRSATAGAGATRQPRRESRRATSTRWPSTRPGHARPRAATGRRWPGPRPGDAAGDGHGDRVLALGLHRRGQGQDLVIGVPAAPATTASPRRGARSGSPSCRRPPRRPWPGARGRPRCG